MAPAKATALTGYLLAGFLAGVAIYAAVRGRLLATILAAVALMLLLAVGRGAGETRS